MFASLMIVDPHSVFCQVVRSLIEKREDLGVMGEASDGHRASDKAREFRPDVIPTEILLPNLNGIDLISRLSEADNRARVAAQRASSWDRRWSSWRSRPVRRAALKVARTIADLAGEEKTGTAAIAEALGYRSIQRE